ncbi:hypothetical protein N9L54_05250 [Porticoccaceae bacterium]|nr:hypothetical protein [Porticoccaceae bacterium]
MTCSGLIERLVSFKPESHSKRQKTARHKATGGVREPVIIEEFPEGWSFSRAAVATAKLKYNPRIVDGRGQEVPGVLHKFTFQMKK